MFAIMKKELKNYFLSPIGYIYVGVFLLTCSIFFYLEIFTYMSTDFASIFGYSMIVLTFIVPLLTMRMFSEERKNGTEQLLLTSPKSITQIVLGKFFAATIVAVGTILSTLFFYAILMFFGKPHFQSSLIAIIGYSLLSIAYVSFGMFASSLTENQIISAIISAGFFILLWLLPDMFYPLSRFSLIYATTSFLNGMVSISDTILLVSFTILFVILTIIVLQKRKLVK